MDRSRLRQRDYEILRTLVRVGLARTRSLQEAFFPNIGVARRRLRILKNGGLIDTHSRGLPGKIAATGGHYWRLTAAGLRIFEAEFPDERVPTNLIDRTKRASLRCFERRDEMTDLYLQLIASETRDMDAMRSRANIIDWRGEHEVLFAYKGVAGAKYVDRRIIPDATVTTRDGRYFVDVDRSTEPHKRCRQALYAYDKAVRQGVYKKVFPDELPAHIVYLTNGRSRAESLADVIASAGLKCIHADAMPKREAARWLKPRLDRGPEGAGEVQGCFSRSLPHPA